MIEIKVLCEQIHDWQMTYNMIYSECVKVFFVLICRVFCGSQGLTQSLFF